MKILSHFRSRCITGGVLVCKKWRPLRICWHQDFKTFWFIFFNFFKYALRVPDVISSVTKTMFLFSPSLLWKRKTKFTLLDELATRCHHRCPWLFFQGGVKLLPWQSRFQFHNNFRIQIMYRFPKQMTVHKLIQDIWILRYDGSNI